MTTMITPPPPASRPRRRSRWVRFSKDPENRSVRIGLATTILLHLLIILVLPKIFRRELAQFVPQERVKEFAVDLESEAKPEEKVPPPKPNQFVEINPDAPDNPPDNTPNFGAQNQQVAQEKPTPDGKSDAPALEGRKDRNSTAIVSGHLEKVEPPTPPTPPTPDQPQPVAEETTPTQKTAQAPLPGFEKIDGDAPDSIGSTVAKIPPPDTRRSPDVVDADPNVRDIVSFNGQVVQIDPKKPQQRQRVAQRNSRPAFLRDNPLGTQNIGPVAYNAKWSEYGEYLQKLIETVQVQWERIIVQSAVYPPPGTVVAVKFTINDEGAITDIAPDDGPAQLQPKRACVSAITARAPYGKWTDDMIAVLGHQQDITFTFYYNP